MLIPVVSCFINCVMEASISSFFSMFVYRLFTSIVISIYSFGSVSSSLKMRLRKSVESMTYNGICCMSGLR